MNPDWPAQRELKAQILESLRAIRETAAEGLDDAEALARAADLEKRIVAGEASPEEIVPDDPFKDVLNALVYRVLPAKRRGGERVTAVRAFLKRLAWDENDAAERTGLLAACGSVGSAMPSAPAPGGAEKPRAPAKPDERSVLEAFERALPLIRTALAEVHDLAESDACEIERELFDWFARFSRREVTCLGHPNVVLLAAASALAREYKRTGSGALGGGEDSRLYEVLDWALSELGRSASASKGTPEASH